MVRLRLYETLSLLPANSLESSYTHLLRMLVAEFTLTENPANTTNSLLRDLCHSDDSIILGTWLQETDHKTIEDQVSLTQYFHLPFSPFSPIRSRPVQCQNLLKFHHKKYFSNFHFHCNAHERKTNEKQFKNNIMNQMEPNRKSHTEHVSGRRIARPVFVSVFVCVLRFHFILIFRNCHFPLIRNYFFPSILRGVKSL